MDWQREGKKGSVHEDFCVPVGAHRFCTALSQISAREDDDGILILLQKQDTYLACFEGYKVYFSRD